MKSRIRLTSYNAIGTSINPVCGDETVVFLKISPSRHPRTRSGYLIIKKADYKTTGCYTAQSSAKTVCKLAKGKTLAEASAITDEQIVSQLPDDLPPKKFHCATLAEHALKNALKNYTK